MKILLRSIICTCFLVATVVSTVEAQNSEPAAEIEKGPFRGDGGKLTIQAGLFQPLWFSGANLAAAYRAEKWVVEYSHGMWLSYDRVGRADTERDQNLDLYNFWTTGFGIGYRLPWRFDIRAEFKAHRYRVTPPEDASFKYTTFSIGPAVHFHQPLYKNLGLDLTVRFWPNVATTLRGGLRAFIDAGGKIATHKAHDFGVFPNVSLGYTF